MYTVQTNVPGVSGGVHVCVYSQGMCNLLQAESSWEVDPGRTPGRTPGRAGLFTLLGSFLFLGRRLVRTCWSGMLRFLRMCLALGDLQTTIYKHCCYFDTVITMSWFHEQRWLSSWGGGEGGCHHVSRSFLPKSFVQYWRLVNPVTLSNAFVIKEK